MSDEQQTLTIEAAYSNYVKCVELYQAIEEAKKLPQHFNHFHSSGSGFQTDLSYSIQDWFEAAQEIREQLYLQSNLTPIETTRDIADVANEYVYALYSGEQTGEFIRELMYLDPLGDTWDTYNAKQDYFDQHPEWHLQIVTLKD